MKKFFKTLFTEKQYNFINLTTGLEHLIEYRGMIFDGFTRFQSTYLESKQWERFIQETDNNILMHLALGRKVCIFDCTSRKIKNNISRAMWQGIPWLMYCLERIWFKRETSTQYGMHNNFKDQYACLTRPTKSRLKYYRKWLKTDKINLGYICYPTDHDSDFEYYQEIVRKYL